MTHTHCLWSSESNASLLLSSDDIPDTPSVMAAVGGGFEDVTSSHFYGRGPEVSSSHLHRPRKPDPGRNDQMRDRCYSIIK